MKPKYLEISGWGPYKNCEKIDFESLGNKGIFLITGPTGAGKTTIFDAICFALYGKVSGDLRGKETLRSDFAENNVKTYVEMIFTHMDNEYKIRRNPKYRKAKVRGTGTTDENESAVLYLGEEVLAEGVSNVNEKIKELLKIDYNQFKQISMIAQGEFQKLLTANSQDRTQIFRDIFNTRLYSKMQDILKAKWSDLKSKLDDLKSKSMETISLINIEDEEWNEIKNAKSINYNLAIEFLEKRKEEQKKVESNFKKQLKGLEDDLKELVKLENKMKQLEESFKQYDRECEKKQELEAKQEQIVELKNTLERIRKAKNITPEYVKYDFSKKNCEELRVNIKSVTDEYNKKVADFKQIDAEYQKKDILEKEQEQLLDNISLLDNQFEIFTQYAQMSKEYNEANDEVKKKKELVEYNKEIVEKAQKQIEDCESKLKEIEKAQTKFLEENSKLIKVNVVLDNISEYREKAAEEIRLVNVYNQKLEIYKELEISAKNMQQNFIERDSTFRMATAGILASQLEENMPCPVCGSLSHPKKAILKNDAPTKEEVDMAKENAETARKKAEEGSKEVAIYKGKIESINKEIESMVEKLGAENRQEIEKIFMETSNEKARIENELKDAKTIVDTKNRYEEFKLKAENGKQEYTDKLTNATESLEVATEKVQKLSGKVSALRTSLKVEFENIESFEKEIVKQKEIYNQLKNRLNIIIEKHKLLLTEVEAKKALLESNEKKLSQAEEETKKLYDAFTKMCIENEFQNVEDYLQITNRVQEEEAISKYIQDYQESVILVKNNIDKLSKVIGDSERPNLEEYRLKVSEVEKVKKECVAESEKVLIVSNDIKKCLNSLKEKNEIFIKIDKEYGKISELFLTSTGNNSQKLMFEQYVLSNYFDDILCSANVRLAKMTDGRYELSRVKGVVDARTKNALDIEVLDNYTGKMRHVNTLSGGESFKAALALAFGTSDIMQNNAGGIVADTLFIDEGFGSLDNESLQQAIEILSSMTGTDRLIGIISHVGELKEQISKQIIVEKSSSGSSITCKLM